MTIRWKSKKLLAVAAAVIAVGGGTGAGVAATQANDPSSERQAFLADAASRLGVQQSQLSDALEQAALDRLDAAVAAGRLTADQASRIRQAIQSGQGMPFGPGRPGGHRGAFAEAAADYLGLTTDELRAQIEGGKSLAQVAQAQGKSVDGLKQAMLADAKSHLDVAVTGGKLTADQAKQILDRLTSHIDDLVNHAGPPAMGPRP
jgi:polyhydroxyalkanoate synthesis regulator phasin